MIVTAVTSPLRAAQGNREEVAIKASITDAMGHPIAGLGLANFKVSTKIVAPFGADVDVTRVVEDTHPTRPMPGFYLVELVPIPAGTWRAGIYLLEIAVENDADHGQTVARLEIA